MEQRTREDAPAAPSTTSTAVALSDFLLLSLWPSCSKPGSQPALLALPAWRAGAPFTDVVPLKVFLDCKCATRGLFQIYKLTCFSHLSLDDLATDWPGTVCADFHPQPDSTAGAGQGRGAPPVPGGRGGSVCEDPAHSPCSCDSLGSPG